MKSSTKKISLLFFVILPLFSFSVLANDKFPLRAKYKDVPVISTEDLRKDYQKVIIVDTRSKFEYDVVHVNNAKFNPVSNILFESRLKKLRDKDGAQKLVFYCNGKTCSKSYRATRKAMKAGYKNVYAYDAGIFAWVSAYPKKATLMNQTPVERSKIISSDELKKRQLSYSGFLEKAKQKNTLVIDIRDPVQREIKLSLDSRAISLNKIKSKLSIGAWKDRELLIYDAVGKQVRWLQYYLEKNGYKNYYFLSKGASGVKKVTVKR